MEFLYEKIYSNQYFALILFATIAILLILFVVVLFAAIKDTKKKQLDGLEKLEQETKDRVLSDDTIFGVSKAFKEETPKEPLEFFKSEDEISKTRDMVLNAPTKDNSMNSLLNEFEDEKKVEPMVSASPQAQGMVNNYQEPVNSFDFSRLNTNQNPVHEDIVMPNVVVPMPNTSSVIPNTDVDPITGVPSLPNDKEMSRVPVMDNIPHLEEDVINQLPKVGQQRVLDDSDDEFELPAIKNNNTNLERQVNSSSVSRSGIDFSKTGILNFNDIESESYEIK